MNGVIICDLKGCFKHRYGIIFLSFQHLQERAVKEPADARAQRRKAPEGRTEAGRCKSQYRKDSKKGDVSLCLESDF